MRLTPLDIRKQEFKKGMRGLDADEVYAFLVTIADEYEAVLNDNKALRERLLELDDKVQEYRNMEKTLRDTLLTAERITVDAKDNARREAELIIKQAELDADKGVRDIKANATRLRQEVKALKSQRESYLARMKILVESHLKFIESAEGDFDEEERLLNPDPVIDEKGPTVTTPVDKATPRPAGDKSGPVAPDTQAPATKSGPETSMPLPPETQPPSDVSRPSAGLARGSTGTFTGSPVEPLDDATANERLNELLDRVVQRPGAAEDQAADDLKTQGTAPEKTPTVEIDGPADGSADGDGGKANSEWSLERLKDDILSRRSKDETD